jgi:hypothetical protein
MLALVPGPFLRVNQHHEPASPVISIIQPLTFACPVLLPNSQDLGCQHHHVCLQQNLISMCVSFSCQLCPCMYDTVVCLFLITVTTSGVLCLIA